MGTSPDWSVKKGWYSDRMESISVTSAARGADRSSISMSCCLISWTNGSGGRDW